MQKLLAILAIALMATCGTFTVGCAPPPEVTNPIGDVVDSAGEAAGAAVDATKEAAGDAIGAAKDAAGGAVDAVKGAAGDAMDAAKDAGSAAKEAVTPDLEGASE